MKDERKQVVYRFKAKVGGGEWAHLKDKRGAPITITTDKGRNSVLYIFRSRYPSFASLYHLGETLIADPDMEATERLLNYKKQKAAEEEESIRTAWWQD